MGGWVSETVDFSNYYHYWVGGCWEKWNLPITFHYVFTNVFFCTLVVKKVFSEKKTKQFLSSNLNWATSKLFFVAYLFQVESYKTIKIKERQTFLLAKVSLFLLFTYCVFHDLDISLDGGSTIKFELSLN